MQNLVRSKTIGVTGNDGRGTAGAGPGREVLYTYDFSSSVFPKFQVMHFQNGDTELYTVVLMEKTAKNGHFLVKK